MTYKAMPIKIYRAPYSDNEQNDRQKRKTGHYLIGLCGQTALTHCIQLAKEVFLEKIGVRLLGSSSGND
jgi:carbamoyl-phosphate synthase large subunit